MSFASFKQYKGKNGDISLLQIRKLQSPHHRPHHDYLHPKLVIVLTRAAPALQYYFLFFFLSWVCCLQLCSYDLCGKNVDTLRSCKRSNRDFFWLRSTENTYILSSPVFLYTRTNLVSKTPILKVLARVSFYWQPMTICGKNVDTLRPCKRSNRDFFWL